MWEIYDEYCKDFERQRQAEAAKAKGGAKKAAAAGAARAGAGGACEHASRAAGADAGPVSP
jgi:hypothetical protein